MPRSSGGRRSSLKNPKALAIGIGALVFIAVGFLFVRGPKPIIEIKGETLAEIGPLPILNTMVTGFTVAIILIVVSFLATRNMKLIPSGLQNLVEAIAEALYNLCIQTAGEKNGRRFFPVAATIFVFICVANWMALTPIFNSFGSVLEVTPHHFHAESQVLTQKSGVGFIFPFSLGADEPRTDFVIDEGGREVEAKDAAAERCAGLAKDTKTECKESIYALSMAEALEKKDYHTDVDGCPALPAREASTAYVPGGPTRQPTEAEHAAWECYHHAYEAGIAGLKADGKKLGIILPYFRSMNTDLNSPLSLAIMSVIFIEFWGITGLGLFKYGSKFLNFSNPIAFFVGILEFIAEFARIISFTFRLFGNMLAGEILLLVMTFMVPFLIALPFYALETFVGMIQAFVFFMLTIAFGALALESHEEHGDDHDAGAEPHAAAEAH